MSSELVAVETAGLSKAYRIGDRAPGSVSFREAVSKFTRWPNRSRDDRILWALRDLSIRVEFGEVLGIVGRNGSGKSTLLKILGRVTAPTGGEARLYGRVGSLLEVGTGFHPELTGRENIFLSGRILGLPTSEIRSHFDEIVAFADVERLLDTAVKRYSSGQYTRLAFAVAGFLQPEILLIDEVLAVGDAEFQRKCLGRMKAVANGGRTVLFVSHNMDAVASLCTRAILLDEGRMVCEGPATDVIRRYLSQRSLAEVASWRGDAGDERIRLRATSARSGDGGPLRTDAEIRIALVLEVRRPVFGLICAVEVFSRDEKMLAYSAYDDACPPPAEDVPPGLLARELTIPPNSLAPGTYEIRFDVGIHNTKRIVDGAGSLVLDVPNPSGIGRRYLTERTRNLFRPAWRWREIEPQELDALHEAM
jgi:lipopolysaccharide transport system ATP-binding protein